jgi:hypothetical protein
MKVIRDYVDFLVDSPTRENVVIGFKADTTTEPYHFEAGDEFGICDVTQDEKNSIIAYWEDHKSEFIRKIKHI